MGILALMIGDPSSDTSESARTSEPAREYVSVTVMMNSDFANGRGPSIAPCMVLFDLDQPGPVSAGKLTEMRRIAAQIYSLYCSDSARSEDAEMAEFIRHLKLDIYRPNCRKAVPSALAGGRRLYVSDIVLHRNMFSPDSELQDVAMVKVTGQSRGTISHIAWNASAISRTAMR